MGEPDAPDDGMWIRVTRLRCNRSGRSAAREPLIRCATMITVGCAGFPVPATRYFREFMFVEVQETHVSLPGPGTFVAGAAKRPNFQFALLGPREVGQEGFRDGKVSRPR